MTCRTTCRRSKAFLARDRPRNVGNVAGEPTPSRRLPGVSSRPCRRDERPLPRRPAATCAPPAPPGSQTQSALLPGH